MLLLTCPLAPLLLPAAKLGGVTTDLVRLCAAAMVDKRWLGQAKDRLKSAEWRSIKPTTARSDNGSSTHDSKFESNRS